MGEKYTPIPDDQSKKKTKRVGIVGSALVAAGLALGAREGAKHFDLKDQQEQVESKDNVVATLEKKFPGYQFTRSGENTTVISDGNGVELFVLTASKDGFVFNATDDPRAGVHSKDLDDLVDNLKKLI